MDNFQKIKNYLISKDSYEETFDKAIEMTCEVIHQYEAATKWIKDREQEKEGSGYIRIYKTGYANISAELVMQRDSIANFLRLSKKLGLTPEDYKAMGFHKKKESVYTAFKNMKKVAG